MAGILISVIHAAAGTREVNPSLRAFFFALAVLTACAPASAVHADFDDLGAGARSTAMGNGSVALADDAFGFYYNPAGPGFVKQGQVGVDYGKLWLGLDDRSDLSQAFATVVIPLVRSRTVQLRAPGAGSSPLPGSPSADDAAVQVSTTAPSSSSGEPAISTGSARGRFRTVHNHWGTISLGWRRLALSGYYQESATYLGFAAARGDKWSAGLNIKMLQEQYTIDQYLMLSPVFEYGLKDSVQGYSVDAGFLYNIVPNLFLGLAVLDVTQPDLGLSQSDRLPMTVRGGLAWRQKDVKWGVDFLRRSTSWYASAGIERWFRRMFAIRGGVQFGGRNFFSPAAGFGLHLSASQLDYVFQFPVAGIKDTGGTHRLSCTFRFGRRPKEELEPGSLELYYSRLQEEVVGLRDSLAKTEDEKSKLEEVLIEEATLRIRERIKAAKAEARQAGAQPAAAVSAAARTPQQEKEPREIRHVVQKGETLQSIAEKYFRDVRYWNEIYQANRDSIGRGGILRANQVLVIPQLSRQEASAETRAESSNAANPSPASSVSQGAVPVKVVVPAAAPQPRPGEVIPIRVAPAQNTVVVSPVKAVKEAPPPVKGPSGPPVIAVKSVSARKHTVQAGENLQSIAQKYYNDRNRWKSIYEMNRDKVIGGQVSPGTEILIP